MWQQSQPKAFHHAGYWEFCHPQNEDLFCSSRSCKIELVAAKSERDRVMGYKGCVVAIQGCGNSLWKRLPATLSVSPQSMPQDIHLHLLPPSSPCLCPGTSPQPGKHKPSAAVLPLLLLCLNLLSLKTKLTQ